MDYEPKRSRFDTFFHVGGYVALAISVALLIVLLVFAPAFLFVMFGTRGLTAWMLSMCITLVIVSISFTIAMILT